MTHGTLAVGDRVRVKAPASEYTGCRGTIVEDPSAGQPGVTPLGYWVAIDGENGVAQPFLVGDLERVAAARVRSAASHPASRRQPGSSPAGPRR